MAILKDVLSDPEPDGQGQGSGGSQDDTLAFEETIVVEEVMVTESDNGSIDQ
jgi:hypothetical protein